MSFFDEGDEPRRAPRARRPAGSGGGRSNEQQTLLVRRLVAAGAILLVVILLVVGIKGCLSSQKKQSLKAYNTSVTSLISDSDTSVGKEFFALLNSGGGGSNSVDLTSQVTNFRVAAEDLVKRARKQDVPDEMKPAQANLLLVLELRRDALRKIGAKLPTALAKGQGDAASKAVAQITGQMEAFLASDVVYSQRVIPYIQKALDDAGVGGQTIPTSQFLPNLTWLDETQVAGRLGSTASRRKGGPVAPGSHGHGLTSVSVGGTDLTQGSTNSIPAGSNLAFTVKFQNQGQNDETAVGVKLTITGAGKTITAQKTVAQTSKGQAASVDVPLSQAPPVGTPVTITVEVEAVPGEKMTDNNKATYQATFTG